jgi:peptidoglycan hydrolase-like protein with peptidoglycan-binding domain
MEAAMTPWRTLLTLVAAVSTAPGAFAMSLSDLPLPPAPKGVHLVAYNSTVYRIQTGLNQLGYDAGPADGVMGARTSSAIRAYERDNGLLVTGQSGLSLLDHIEISIDRRRSAQTQQLPPVQPVVPATTATSASRSTIIGIQSELRRRGFDVPVISGTVDDKTRAAIRSYQGLASLPVTGQASEALLAHMSDRAATATTVSQRDLLKRIQTALIERGYDPGPADGGMGPKTRSAIQTYQSDAGLPITGEASTSLLARLEGTSTTTTLSQRDLTRRTQAALIERGYDPGPVNGNVTTRTRLAIQTYQADSGLQVTGEPSTSLLAQLEDPNTMVPRSDDLGGDEIDSVRYDLVRRFHDRFRDGDFTRDPAWSVVAGNFFVEKGVLRTTIEPRVASTSDDDVGATILRGILQGALGVPTQTREFAQIASATRIDNAFHIVMKVASNRDAGRLLLGVYQGGSNDGYRLAYASAERPTFELLSARSGSVRVVDTSSSAINLEDGNSHVIEWFRLPDGEMIVNVDDLEVMRVRDKGHMQDFDGITIVNVGGDYGIGEVVIDAVVPAKS